MHTFVTRATQNLKIYLNIRLDLLILTRKTSEMKQMLFENADHQVENIIGCLSRLDTSLQKA